MQFRRRFCIHLQRIIRDQDIGANVKACSNTCGCFHMSSIFLLLTVVPYQGAPAALQTSYQPNLKATVHQRWVVIVPTPTWYRERRSSHNRNYVTCAAENTPVFTCSVFSGNVTSGSIIAPGRLGNIASGTICEISS